MLTSEATRLFLTSRKAKGLSLESLRWYEGILSAFAQTSPELPDKPEEVEAFIGSCEAGDERRHGYYRCLKALYRFLRKRYGVQNPIDMLDAPRRKTKKPKPLTIQELNDLLAYPHAPLIKASLMFLADTGARIGELAGLSIEDFTETPWGYTVVINGKTGERTVPVSPHAYRAMLDVLPFTVSPYRLRRLISKAFRDARVKGTAHTLRHTFATLFSGDETILQRIMGHQNISTTIGYRALRMEKMCEQHRAYSPLSQLLRSTKNLL